MVGVVRSDQAEVDSMPLVRKRRPMPDIIAARAGRGCRGGIRASDAALGCRIPSGFRRNLSIIKH